MAVFRGTDRIRRAARAARRHLRHVRSLSLKGMTVVETKMLPMLKRHWKKERGPVVAAAIALTAVALSLYGQHYMKVHATEYYKVYVNGTPVGEISSREKVEQWMSAKSAEMDRADTPLRLALDEGQITYKNEKAYKKRTDDETTLAALSDTVTSHPVGTRLIIGGKVAGIVRDRATADSLLQRIKDKYAPRPAVVNAVAAAKTPAAAARTLAFTPAEPKNTAAVPGRLVTSVEFLENIQFEDVAVSAAGVQNPDDLYRELLEGGSASWIDDAGDMIDRSGRIPLLNVQSVEQVTELEPVEAVVEYRTSKDMRVGRTQVLREGSDGEKMVTYRLVKRNGSVIEEEIVKETVLRKAVSTIILKGTKVIEGEGTGKFSWPVLGHRITSYMGKRWGRMHKGIDIIGRSSILAADNGIVEFAGYNSGGLGNSVIIDHRNGFKTVYGHMRSIKVKKGQIVEKGDMLGVMGSTGHSTGTHLHFEVYLNGKLKNPTGYL